MHTTPLIEFDWTPVIILGVIGVAFLGFIVYFLRLVIKAFKKYLNEN